MKSKLEPKISVTFYLKKISLKAEKAREQKHIDQARRGAFEAMGVMGIIPFYKDAKDHIGRNDFKGERWTYSVVLFYGIDPF